MLPSRSRGLSLRIWIGLIGAALIISFPLGYLRDDRPMLAKDGPLSAAPSTPAPKPQPARNPTQLTVLVEPGVLLGWVSGTGDRAGATAIIRRSGLKPEDVKVEPGNTFTWSYKVEKEMSADVQVGDLRQTVTLLPAAKTPPTVFFILDRFVFRPGQSLHFAAFLRIPDVKGEFVPISGKSVEVKLVSEKKKTTAKKWQLITDAFGKITGEYAFGTSDPLETYTLSIDGHKGSARIALAEYRKLTNQLSLVGEVEAGRLKIRFETVDFQGQPVPAEKIHLTTQIITRPHKPDVGELNPAEFVYATTPAANQPTPDGLGEDEQLIARFHSGPISFASAVETVVWESKNEKKVGSSGKGELTLDIPEKWRQGRFTAMVQGVLTDSAGREMRAVRTIPLDGTDRTLQLSLTKSTYSIDEPIRVKAFTKDPAGLKGSASLVALRLTPVPQPAVQPTSFGGTFTGTFSGTFSGGYMGIGGASGFSAPGGFGYSGMGFGHGTIGMSGPFPGSFSMGSHPGFGFNPPPCSSFHFGTCFGTMPSYPFPSNPKQHYPPKATDYGTAPTIDRKFVTAAVFQGDSASLKLPEPGAYKLVVVWNHADGRKLQQEIGCVVRKRDELPGLSLQLEKESLESSDPLAGTIQSRFADARVLLVLRDSSGFRLAKPIRLKDGRAEFREELPKDLKYGACIEVIYSDRPTLEEPAHHASQFIHVVPRNRIITVNAKHKPTYEPGDKVTLDLEVNRKEAVDLVVSVYDRALLDVHSGEQTDIRNFYLADDRVKDGQARDLLRRKVGGVAVMQLLRRADALTKTMPKDGPDATALKNLLTNYQAKKLSLDDVATLLRLAGLHARHVVVAGAKAMPEIQLRQSNVTLMQLIEGPVGGWKIHLSTFYDTVLIAETHPTERPQPYPPPVANAPQPFGYPQYWPGAYPRNFMGGMVGMGGMTMSGMGGFPVGFNSSISGGFAGFGGGGFQGYYSHLPPLVSTVPTAKPPENIKVPGGLDTGEAWIRRDFSDLAHWNARVRTDENGKARVEFKLPDSLTVWQVQVIAISKEMHVGSTTTSLQASRPVMVSPVLPRLFAEGDEVMVSAIVLNRSGVKQTLEVKLDVVNGQVTSPAKHEVELAANAQLIVSWKFKAGEAGYTQLLISASCPAGKDASLKRLPVVRAGADQVVTWSGYAKGQATLVLPDGVTPEHAKLDLTFAPTLAADLVDTLDFLVEYPYGCVEQTMSRFLPAVKVAQVLKKKKIEKPELMKKLPAAVEAGIKRLIELQQADGGWAWHGTGQTHEMMTPYALYGLIEAERAGYAIPSEKAIPMGLARLRKYIDSMGDDQTADRIYCMSVYSLKHDLDDEWWKFIERQWEAKKLSDYALALSLEMSVRLVRTKLAEKLAVQLRQRAVEEDGHVFWRTAGFSRWGDDRFETTAAAMRALVVHDKDDPMIGKVVSFFTKTKRGNRWNSTKDTAMIVYAMCDYLERLRDDSPDGSKVVLRVNDGEPIEVAVDGKHESRTVAVPAKLLREGTNLIRFEKSPGGMMVRANLRFVRSGKNVAPLESGLKVTRQLWLIDATGQPSRELKSGDTVPKGAYLMSVVEAVKPGKDSMRFLLVENPIPAGAEVIPLDDKRYAFPSSPFVLREEREGKVVFHHEQAPPTTVDRCVLHVEMAGDFVLPPARAELMYQTDKFGHSGTFSLRVE